MRLIDADRFLQDMEGLYRQAGWDEREVHFSLADLRSNIDMEDVAVIPCKDCAHYHNWAHCPMFFAIYRTGYEQNPDDYCSRAERKEE